MSADATPVGSGARRDPDWQKVATVDEFTTDLPIGCSATLANGEDLEIAIVQHQGEWFAIRDECSHAKVPLSEGDVVGGTIECYLHGSVFNLRTGQPENLPATQPVPVFPVRIDGDDVLVDLANPSFDADW
ncbi:Rieske (2Fe-2S) protein [Aestuariimicrobium soli]|uniref:Rieske (2Fe-2S) protein n=1 Tax=Aestuariimicrobium soli TaxID=2035834 RepID=UPI003EB6E45A